MSCMKKVIDVFATTAADLDEFVAPVWSVDVRYVTNEYHAYVIDAESDWITTASGDFALNLEKGDLVRIGGSGSGFTDYATVLDKVKIAKIGNLTTTSQRWKEADHLDAASTAAPWQLYSALSNIWDGRSQTYTEKRTTLNNSLVPYGSPFAALPDDAASTAQRSLLNPLLASAQYDVSTYDTVLQQMQALLDAANTLLDTRTAEQAAAAAAAATESDYAAAVASYNTANATERADEAVLDGTTGVVIDADGYPSQQQRAVTFNRVLVDLILAKGNQTQAVQLQQWLEARAQNNEATLNIYRNQHETDDQTETGLIILLLLLHVTHHSEASNRFFAFYGSASERNDVMNAGETVDEAFSRLLRAFAAEITFTSQEALYVVRYLVHDNSRAITNAFGTEATRLSALRDPTLAATLGTANTNLSDATGDQATAQTNRDNADGDVRTARSTLSALEAIQTALDEYDVALAAKQHATTRLTAARKLLEEIGAWSGTDRQDVDVTPLNQLRSTDTHTVTSWTTVSYYSTTAVTIYAYRLSLRMNATSPPHPPELRPFSGLNDVLNARLMKNRYQITMNEAWARDTGSDAWPLPAATDDTWTTLPHKYVSPNRNASGVRARQMPYPLFRMRAPPPFVKVQWDRGVKQVHWIKLVGASLFDKRQAGFEAQHELYNDDYLVVHVDEISGETVSNSEAVRGAFAVLHAGTSNDVQTGAVEVHAHEPQGLVEHHFERPRTDLHSMTLRFKDARGGDAHFGRIHLWFKLCVSHG